MKKWTRLVSLAMVLAMALVAVAYAEDTIRFSVSSPLTGDSAEQGLMPVHGAQMAVDEINAAGGVNGKMLELVAMDDQANANQAVIVAEKVVADSSIEFALAPMYSGCTMAAMPTYDAAGLTVLGPGNSRTDLTEQGWKTYLRICPADKYAIQTLVDYAMEQGFTKPFIFYANSANEVSAYEIEKEYLKTQYGIDIVGSETFSPETDRDFSAHVAKVKASGADVVLMACEYSPGGLFAKQLANAGVKVQMMGLGGLSNAALVELAGEDVEGLMCTSAFDPTNPDEGVQNFVNKFVETYGNVPTDAASWAYESIYAVAEAYEAGATSENLGEWMRENTDYKGMTGDIKFNENGDNILAKTYILQITDGVYKLIA